MQVLGFGTYDASLHPRIAVLLSGLRRRGVDVREVNAPLGFTTAERIAMTENPLRAYRFVFRLLGRWALLARRGRRIAHQGKLDAVLVGYLGHFDVLLARLLFPRTTIVLDQLIFAADTAVDRRLSGATKLWLLQRLDRVAVRCASMVLLDTEEHISLLRPKDRAKAVVVPVGAGYEWFVVQHREPSDDDVAQRGTEAPLQIVFFGLFTPLQGAPVIAEAIASLPAELPFRLSMFGSGQDRATAARIIGSDPRVLWRDWVDPSDLPAEISAHDVCLGIFGTSAKARRVVPNKVFQGAAVGCAIVTANTEPQRRALGNAATFITPGDSAQLAATLTELVLDRRRVRRLRVAAAEVANAHFRPEQIAAPLLAALAGPH